MGCGYSKSGNDRDLSGSNAGRLETIMPDPDLGWRRNDRSITPAGYRPPGVIPPTMYPLPGCWNVVFVGIEGMLYSVSLVALALNIAVRSSSLARRFHVSELQTIGTVPKPCDDFTTEDDHTIIYRVLDVPNYNWRLVHRAFGTTQKKKAGWFHAERGHGGAAHAAHEGQKQQHHGGPDQSIDLMAQMQRLQQRNNEHVIGDVAEIAMNIAEQLYRLESKQVERHALPNNTFGWQILNQCDGLRILVASPEGDAYLLVPEELIMNVTSWVQQTYLTQPGGFLLPCSNTVACNF